MLFISYGRWKNEKTVKGVKKNVKKSIMHEDFKKTLFTGSIITKKQNLIRSRHHNLYTETMKKIALSADDDKRIILPDKISTLAIGHKKIYFLVYKMKKIEIIVENGNKKIFLTFKEAGEFLGMKSTSVYQFIKKEKSTYKRKDGKVFNIQEEKEKFCSIDGEDFHTFQQIKDKYGISSTVFINQITRKKNFFLDENEISHFVSDFSPELEKMISCVNMAKANKINGKVPRDIVRYQLPYKFKRDKNFMEVCNEFWQLSNDEEISKIANKNETKKEIEGEGKSKKK